MGNFNLNLMNYQTNNLTGEFLDSMYSNLLCPLINWPTRITSPSYHHTNRQHPSK